MIIDEESLSKGFVCPRVKAKLLADLIKMLEEDSQNVLNFMASNGLVTNASKTALIIMNLKGEDLKKKIEVKIGSETIEPQSNARLLGMQFQNDLNWSEHIHGKGGVISSLNQRLFIIKRLHNSLEKRRL